MPLRTVQRYAVMFLSLGTLFATGLAIGYRIGQESASGVAMGTVKPGPGNAVPTADEWAVHACEALRRDLSLTPTQAELVRQHLASVSRGIFLDRDRALFQIHLRLLEVHDMLSRDLTLDEPQRLRLKSSREKLRALITERFAEILKDNPDATNLLQASKV